MRWSVSGGRPRRLPYLFDFRAIGGSFLGAVVEACLEAGGEAIIHLLGEAARFVESLDETLRKSKTKLIELKSESRDHRHGRAFFRGGLGFGFGLIKLFGLALIAALWAYDGWYVANCTAQEIKSPERIPAYIYWIRKNT